METVIGGLSKDTLYQLGIGGFIALAILSLVFAFVLKLMSIKKENGNSHKQDKDRELDGVKKWLASIDKKVDDMEVKLASNYTRQEIESKLDSIHSKIDAIYTKINKGG